MFTVIQSTVPWINSTTITSRILGPEAVGLIALVTVKSDRFIGSPEGTQKLGIGHCYATYLSKLTVTLQRILQRDFELRKWRSAQRPRLDEKATKERLAYYRAWRRRELKLVNTTIYNNEYNIQNNPKVQARFSATATKSLKKALLTILNNPLTYSLQFILLFVRALAVKALSFLQLGTPSQYGKDILPARILTR